MKLDILYRIIISRNINLIPTLNHSLCFKFSCNSFEDDIIIHINPISNLL